MQAKWQQTVSTQAKIYNVYFSSYVMHEQVLLWKGQRSIHNAGEYCFETVKMVSSVVSLSVAIKCILDTIADCLHSVSGKSEGFTKDFWCNGSLVQTMYNPRHITRVHLQSELI